MPPRLPPPIQRVTIESPWRTTDASTRARYLSYARDAVADALARGEAPFASHLLYTQPGIATEGWTDDADPAIRARGLAAGLAWTAQADCIAVYVDLGITEGMLTAIATAQAAGIKVENRSLRKWWIAVGATCGSCADYDISGGECRVLSTLHNPREECPLPPGAGWRPRPQRGTPPKTPSPIPTPKGPRHEP